MDFGPSPPTNQITNVYFNNFVIIRVIHLVVQWPVWRDFASGWFYYHGSIFALRRGHLLSQLWDFFYSENILNFSLWIVLILILRNHILKNRVKWRKCKPSRSSSASSSLTSLRTTQLPYIELTFLSCAVRWSSQQLYVRRAQLSSFYGWYTWSSKKWTSLSEAVRSLWEMANLVPLSLATLFLPHGNETQIPHQLGLELPSSETKFPDVHGQVSNATLCRPNQ